MRNVAGMHAQENQKIKSVLMACKFCLFFELLFYIFLFIGRKKVAAAAAVVTIATTIDLRFIFIILGLAKKNTRKKYYYTHFVYFVYILSSSGFRWISVQVVEKRNER